MPCPLCLTKKPELIFERQDRRWGRRVYYRCGRCRLIFLPPELYLSSEEEKRRYSEHRNFAGDDRYTDFLGRLLGPLCRRLRSGDEGLDYGCGPNPVMSGLLQAMGYGAAHYDPYFFPEKKILKRKYDFVTLSEVAEHFRRPRREWRLLDRLLKPGGRLGVMTGMTGGIGDFARWYYHRDPTHISFYEKKTFDWIAGWRGWKAEFPAKNVVVFEKKG